MRSGGLRHRLVIEENQGSGTSHSMGGRSDNWVEVIRVRARAAYTGGKEYERARQHTAELKTLFVIRFDSRIDTKALHAMRLRSLGDNAIYNIAFADDVDHRQRSIHIHTTESQAS